MTNLAYIVYLFKILTAYSNFMEEKIVDTLVEKVVEKKKNGFIYNMSLIIRHILAILIWSYTLIKLFVFDVDVVIVTKFFPEHLEILNYKLFLFIAILAIIVLTIKNKRVISWLLYIIFYPIILIFWKIPFFIFKQKSWTLAFAFINAVISFFKSIRYTLIVSSLYIIFSAIIVISSNGIILWIATLAILLITLVTYARRFIFIFKPSSVFQFYSLIFSKIKKFGSTSASIFMLDEKIKNKPYAELDNKQMEVWVANLQTSVLYNRVCLFVAKKLRDYQTSRLNIVYYVFGILGLIISTVLSFSFINYGIYKINAHQFYFENIPTYFTFFYYSFNNLLFSSIKEISSVLPISQAISMIESFLSLALIGIFVTLLFSVKGEKHIEELNIAIADIENQGVEMEGFIKDEYKILDIDEAMSELKKLKAGMIKFIYIISDNLKNN